MGKNNYLINLERRMRKQLDGMLPKVYAAFCIALHEEGWGFKRISRVLVRSQELWNESVNTGEDMCKKCLELTGIDVEYGLYTKNYDGWGEK